MPLKEELKTHGDWLFRWRSYLPLAIVPLLLISLRNSECLERILGDFAEDVWEIFCILLSFGGLIIRCITIGFVTEGSSGRNTKEQKTDKLNTTGMYSIVRHPLYLGNFFIYLGLALFIQVWWFVLIFTLGFWLYYERIMFAEEEFLRKKFGRSFVEWADKTPAFIPDFSRWKRHDLPFSLRLVLRREYSGFFAIVASLTFLEIGGDLVAENTLEMDPAWIAFFVFGLTTYLTLRTLKKKTSLLDVEGR